MKKRNLQLIGISVVALVLTIAFSGILPATAADVTVTRDLPTEPVYTKDEIIVSLTQSGFYTPPGAEGGIGNVTETLPEGFTFCGLVSGNVEGIGYIETTRNLTIDFENEVTVTYCVKRTAEEIEDAVFSGTWNSADEHLDPINGRVGGNDTLAVGEGEKPTPTPTATPTPGGNGGGGNGGGTVPTPTPSLTPTVTPEIMSSASPGPTLPVSPGETVAPTVSPTSSPEETPTPTKKPLIPGFEAVFAVAGLLAVAHLVIRRGRRV